MKETARTQSERPFPDAQVIVLGADCVAGIAIGAGLRSRTLLQQWQLLRDPPLGQTRRVVVMVARPIRRKFLPLARAAGHGSVVVSREGDVDSSTEESLAQALSGTHVLLVVTSASFESVRNYWQARRDSNLGHRHQWRAVGTRCSRILIQPPRKIGQSSVSFEPTVRVLSDCLRRKSLREKCCAVGVTVQPPAC